MDFSLTREQQLSKQMFEKFVENEVRPIAAEIDETERFPIETVKKMAKLGMMGIPFEREVGGAGGDFITYIMAVEELAKACATTSVILSAHTSLCCWPIYTYGTEEQKAKYLPKLLK
ncbi:acyl-CoA dehydrogenase family protein, partial [Caloramator proteoclasticus]